MPRPYWLWLAKGTKWLTYDAAGEEKAQAEFFGIPRKEEELPDDKPPKWLTDMYWAKTSPGPTKQGP